MDGQASTTSPFDQVWQALKRRRLTALVLFGASLATIASIVSALPDLYRGTASVLIDPGSVPESFIRTPVSTELEPRLYAVTEEVLSRQNLGRLVEQHGLYAEMRQTKSENAVIERMRRDIHIEREQVQVGWGQGTTIAFQVVYHGFDRQTVAAVANDIADLYVLENSRLRERQATETTAFLKAQLDEVEARLNGQERAVNAYREARLGQLPEQQAANLATLERLYAQLRLNNENQLRAMDARSEILRRTEGEGGGVSSLSDLRRELAATRARVNDAHPDVMRLRAEIAALERQESATPAFRTGDRDQQRLRDLDAELEALRREEARLRQSTAVYEERIENVPRREQELAALTRDYAATREQYSSLVARYEEASLGETLELSNDRQFRLLDRAVPPESPAGPPRTRLLVMGLIVSLMLAAGGVVLAEQLDSSFHTIDELKGFTNVPVVGGIPRIITRGDVARGWGRAGVSTAGLLVLVSMLAVAGYLFGTGNTDLVMLMAQRGS